MLALFHFLILFTCLTLPVLSHPYFPQNDIEGALFIAGSYQANDISQKEVLSIPGYYQENKDSLTKKLLPISEPYPDDEDFSPKKSLPILNPHNAGDDLSLKEMLPSFGHNLENKDQKKVLPISGSYLEDEEFSLKEVLPISEPYPDDVDFSPKKSLPILNPHKAGDDLLLKEMLPSLGQNLEVKDLKKVLPILEPYLNELPETKSLPLSKYQDEQRKHISKHMEGVISNDTLQDMQKKQVMFMFFTALDRDSNDKIDGLELIQTVLQMHSNSRAHKHTKSKCFTDDELISWVDSIFQIGDKNSDGFINFEEYMTKGLYINFFI